MKKKDDDNDCDGGDNSKQLQRNLETRSRSQEQYVYWLELE